MNHSEMTDQDLADGILYEMHFRPRGREVRRLIREALRRLNSRESEQSAAKQQLPPRTSADV